MSIEDKNMISVIDVKTMKVEKSWPITPGEEPSGLALDNETGFIFCHGYSSGKKIRISYFLPRRTRIDTELFIRVFTV